MEPFNGSVETSFFGLNRVNVQLLLTEEKIASRHIVRLEGDIVYFNVSFCGQADRHWTAILHNLCMALCCLLSFVLQLSLFQPFWQLAKSRGPAFYILLNLLFCSAGNVLLFVFLVYLEAVIGFRPAIPFDFDYYLKQWPSRGETVFYFLYTLNRCAALIFPFHYSSMFTTRNALKLIGLGWAYCLVDRAEWLLANKGMNMVHCLGPDNEVDDGFQPYAVVMNPWMVSAEWVSRKIYWLLWDGPMVMDACTLAKLFYDKYKLQFTWPWLTVRPIASDQILEGRSERIRLFLICLITTVYHFFWAYTVGGYGSFDVPSIVYNYSYLLENAMPYLLMLWISRDIRSQWKRTMPCGKRSGRTVVVHPANVNNIVYSSSNF